MKNLIKLVLIFVIINFSVSCISSHKKTKTINLDSIKKAIVDSLNIKKQLSKKVDSLKVQNQLSEKSMKVQNQLYSGNKFVGSWVVIESNSGHGLDGTVSEIEYYKNTRKTFIFYYYIDNPIMLSATKDKNILTSSDGGILIKFDSKRNFLKVWFYSDENWVLLKKME